MLHNLIEKIVNVETVQEYNETIKELADCLRELGEPDKAHELIEVASLRTNRFSKREAEADFDSSKIAVVDYCRLLQMNTGSIERDQIEQLLENFHMFCKKSIQDCDAR